MYGIQTPDEEVNTTLYLKTNKNEHVAEDSRFPDFGPCNLEEWNAFLPISRKKFYENWYKPFTHKETLRDFELGTHLGSGTFGSVILIKHKDNENYYAMKMLKKERIMKNKQVDAIKCEKLMLQCLNFPLTIYLKYFFKDNSYIYLVTPFIPGGELLGHLKKFKKFDEVASRFYVSQMVLAIEYLHYLDLVHRDLKPENILIDHTGYLKLGDFGLCKHLTTDRTYTLCGTPEYLAPEVILNKGYGKSVDWWGIGILMYELTSGNPPFISVDPMKLYRRAVANRYMMPSFFSKELKDLVKNILQVDLTRRYGNLKNGVNDIKDHRWFKTTNWMAVLCRKATAPYKPSYKYPGDTTNIDTVDNVKQWESPEIATKNQYAEVFDDF